MLEVRNLTAGYGRVEVLWDVELDVGKSEIVALVGSNGAGKTTLLRAISGIVTPSAGSVTLDGVELAGLAPERIVDHGISHVPEGRRLFAGLTVRENLKVGGYRHGHADLDRAVEVFPKLGERMGQLAGSLSGGEQQMCAIARGLMSEPRLVMIDELSLGLSPKLVDEMLERLVEIAGRGMAVLLVDQDADAALEIAQRGYVLETGRMATSGRAEELLSDDRVREAYLGVA
jgi:branched-chain amino acid transport system ATP-binding protein